MTLSAVSMATYERAGVSATSFGTEHGVMNRCAHRCGALRSRVAQQASHSARLSCTAGRVASTGSAPVATSVTVTSGGLDPSAIPAVMA